jgi:hypothetical protein
MKTCHELRREVIAYFGEHYDPENGNAEEIWDQAVKHVMGPEPQLPIEQWRHTLPREQLEKATRVGLAATELLEALKRLNDDNATDVFSDEWTAEWIFSTMLEKLKKSGLNLDDFDALDSVSRGQELYWVVSNWLLTCAAARSAPVPRID